MELKGRAVDIEKYDQQGYVCITGVKKHNQYKYENGGYGGGNGTYYQADPDIAVHEINLKVVAYTDNGHQTIVTDIRDQVLRDNPNWKRITQNRMNALQTKIVGNKFDFEVDAHGDMNFPLGTFKC